MISIIIPTLNEAQCIGRILAQLSNNANAVEVIVVDGGSTDGTDDICQSFPEVQFVQMTSAQRARQMNHGARKASGEILLFLHADTLPPPNFVELIEEAMSDINVIAGAFSIQFDADHWILSLISSITRLNITWLTFGDHGIFTRKTDFLYHNGYSEIPILEDLELQIRLKEQGVLVRPSASVITSARRFVNNGILRQTMRDFMILVGYFIGIQPEKLAQYYSNSAKSAR